MLKILNTDGTDYPAHEYSFPSPKWDLNKYLMEPESFTIIHENTDAMTDLKILHHVYTAVGLMTDDFDIAVENTIYEIVEWLED